MKTPTLEQIVSVGEQIEVLKKRQSRARYYAYAGRITFDIAEKIDARLRAKLNSVREEFLERLNNDK